MNNYELAPDSGIRTQLLHKLTPSGIRTQLLHVLTQLYEETKEDIKKTSDKGIKRLVTDGYHDQIFLKDLISIVITTHSYRPKQGPEWNGRVVKEYAVLNAMELYKE
jgi:hypothetical protein